MNLQENISLNNLDKTLTFKDIDMESEYLRAVLMTEIIKMKLNRILKLVEKNEEISEKSPT